MKKPLAAMLLSALVYPGAGHLFLKKYKAGLAFVCVFSVPLFLVISETVTRANQIAGKIIQGEIPLDVAAITESLANITSPAESQEFTIKSYLMCIVWAIAIADSYRAGRKEK
jgi:hypothetical protein